LPEDHDKADDSLVLEQRHLEHAARSAEVYQRATIGVAPQIGFGGEQILDLDEGFSLEQTVKPRARTVFQRLVSAKCVVSWGEPIGGGGMGPAAVEGAEHTEIGPAELHRLAEHGVEHRR